MTFHTQKNQPYACCLLIKLLNPPPPQFHHDLTCSHNFRGGKYEEAEQDKNRGGVCCKLQGWTVGENHKGVKEQEYEERGGGTCPYFLEEE